QDHFTYGFNADIKSVELAPLIDLLRPDLKGQVGGVLTMVGQAGGDSPTVSGCIPNLNGVVTGNISDAHLEKVPGVQKILKKLGFILGSPEVAASTVDYVEVRGKITAGKIWFGTAPQGDTKQSMWSALAKQFLSEKKTSE